VITEIFKSKAIIVGSPTINRGILTSVAAMLELIKGLKFKKKKAAAFGCYGWSGESVKIISDRLEASGFEMADEILKVNWNPDNESVEKCIEYGKRLSDIFK
jgi:anaerobic nitric oxide reductase flavorubredoxin